MGSGYYIEPSRPIQSVLMILCVVYLLGFLTQIANAPDQYQWDLRASHRAARLIARGMTPYSDSNMRAVAMGEPGQVPRFVYPPVVLLLSRPLARFPWETVYRYGLAAKVLILLWLVGLWTRRFIGTHELGYFGLFMVFALGGTLFAELRMGSVGLLEVALLWGGFAYLTSGKILRACVLIVAGACFRFMPIVFLGLLPFYSAHWPTLVAILGIGVFVALQLASAAALAIPFGEFIRYAGLLSDEPGAYNPSSLSLCRDLIQLLQNYLHSPLPPWAPLACWGGFVVLVLLVSALAGWGLAHRTDGQRDERIIVLACLTYGLVVPRLKDFGFVLLLVPTYLALRRSTQTFAGLTALLAAIVLTGDFPPLFAPYLKLAAVYKSLLLVLAAWAVETSTARLRPFVTSPRT
jgi:hypothetical protein